MRFRGTTFFKAFILNAFFVGFIAALSVEFRSGWTSNPNDIELEEFKILLTWGGPALRVIGELNQYKEPENIKMQFQDWGTYWTDFQITENR